MLTKIITYVVLQRDINESILKKSIGLYETWSTQTSPTIRIHIPVVLTSAELTSTLPTASDTGLENTSIDSSRHYTYSQ